MKRFKFLFSFITLNILLITAISAQWLETTIYLPDSSGPYALGYNSVNNKIYCANFGFDNNYDSTVTVIDGATNNIITTLNTGYRPYSFCYNPTNNKVYCINLVSGTLTVINGEFDTIITTLAIGNPVALCYDNINNVLLCANSLTGPGELKLIDGNTNQVLFSIDVGEDPRALALNSFVNKVYCACDYGLLYVIDGVTYSVIYVIALNSRILALYYLANRKLYCVTDTGVILPDTIFEGIRPRDICYNLTNNQVYFANYDSNNVIVLDGTTDSVITIIPVGDGPCALNWNSLNNKVYCANYGSGDVSVIDGVTNSVDTTIPVGAGPRAFAWNPIQNRTYVANYLSSSISVIRDVGGGIEERQMLHAERLLPEIYPNPAKGVIRVRGTFSEKTIKIFDISGKLVKVSEKVTSAQSHKQEVRISLKGINPGIYFLITGKETKKFLVVK